MTTPQVQMDSAIQLPSLYISGMAVSNDPTTPNTKVNIAAGMCRDSNNLMDIMLGAANPDAEGLTVAAPLVVNSAVVGANGIDAGALAASTLYAVYVIADSRGYKTTAGLLSLASNSTPTMPFGYDSYRLIGYAATDGAVHFLAGYESGNGSWRRWTYDAPQQVLNGGNSAALANIALTALVPNQSNCIAIVQSDFNANAADNLLVLTRFGSTQNQIAHHASVAGATALTTNNDEVLVGLNSGAPTIKYSVSAGSVNVFVLGFEYFI